MTPRVRMLITGAAGFIGAAVVRAALARGHQVIRLVRTGSPTASMGDATVVADLGDDGAVARALDGIDVVVHCAASLTGGPEAQARDTIAATETLVGCMQARGVARLVLVSSLAVYDFRAPPAGSRLDESSPLEADAGPRGPYVGAKLAQERTVQGSASLDWRIVRPGLVFGPGRGWFYHLGIPLGGRVWLALAGGAELPLIDVDNCAAAVVAAAEAGPGRVIANLVDDARPTRTAYMTALASATAPGVRIADVPWSVLAAAGALAHGVRLTPGMLHPARLAARCKPLTYDNAVAKAAFGWRPAMPMAEALRRLRQQG